MTAGPVNKKGPRAAVDVGGTFTDLLFMSTDGLYALKVPSTPQGPERGVLEAIDASVAETASGY